MAKNLQKVKREQSATTNLLPFQADPYKAISYKSPNRFNNDFLRQNQEIVKIALTPSPNHTEKINIQQKNSGKQFVQIQAKKINKQMQTEILRADAQTQTDFEIQNDTKQQLQENNNFNEELIFSQLSDKSQRFSQLIKMRRDIVSSQSIRKPRAAESFMNEPQILDYQFSPETIQKLENLSLMQVILLQDPYTFQQLYNAMMHEEDVQDFLVVTSKEIDKKLNDLDLSNIKYQREIADRINQQLEKFSATLNLALQAFHQARTSLNQTNQNNIYDEMMKDMQSQLVKYQPEILIPSDSNFFNQFQPFQEEQEKCCLPEISIVKRKGLDIFDSKASFTNSPQS